MNDIFLRCLSLSLSGSLVAIILILFQPFLRRFSKTWQYYIWLLVILRLLIPLSPKVSMIGQLSQPAETQTAVQNETAENAPDFAFSAAKQPTAVFDAGDIGQPESNGTIISFSVLKDHFWGALWLITAIILLARKIIGYAGFLKAVKQESRRINDGQLSNVLQTVSTAMGIKKKISICINPLVRAPMLIGFLRPVIVLPNETMHSLELALILRHELIHYRRKDILYKWLAEIAVCLHWFNPFAYWVRKQINRDCEFSCDESVVSCLGATQRQTYGKALLGSIVINNSKTKAVSLSLNEDGKLIQKRLDAIMHYHKKSKWVVFTAIVLTLVMFCGTVFAGAYTAAAVENVKSSPAAGFIRISGKDIAPGGKVSFDSQQLLSETQCQVLLTWNGAAKLSILCTLPSGAANSLSIESGKEAAIQIQSGGEYTIAVKNDSTDKVENVNGTIEFKQTPQKPQTQRNHLSASLNAQSALTVTYENVEMRRYEGEDGHLYSHDTRTNGTADKIVGSQYGMLAFDQDGNPLKIDWWSLDTESESTYFYLSEDLREIEPGVTDDERGGWSLNVSGNDPSVEKIAYMLYCDKEITFEDGTVWTNPDFDNWRLTYEGKKTKVSILDKYYPYKQNIVVLNKPVIKKASAAGKEAVNVSWKKDSRATGYQIQLSTSKRFDKSSRSLFVKKNKTMSYTVKRLASNQKYYVRMRSYKIVNKKKYYSGWSNQKSVRTK